MRTVAILLAAGDSRRMGSPKALLDWRGRPLLEHQIDILCRSRVAECIVVLGRDADRLAPLVAARPCAATRARVVRNPRPDLGRSSSVRVGLEALTTPAEVLLFASVDQPLSLPLVEALIEAAAAAWRGAAIGAAEPAVVTESSAAGATAVTPAAATPAATTPAATTSAPAILIPIFEGRRGHPILFHGALLPELLAVGEKSLGLRGVIHRRPERVREVPWNSAEILLDLNTPADATRAGAVIPSA